MAIIVIVINNGNNSNNKNIYIVLYSNNSNNNEIYIYIERVYAHDNSAIWCRFLPADPPPAKAQESHGKLLG